VVSEAAAASVAKPLPRFSFEWPGIVPAICFSWCSE
jgi:hypothetical protein